MQHTQPLVRFARSTFASLGLSALLLVGVNLGEAQSDTGRVTGTVADTSGAFMPGATIRITDTDTGAVETKTTGDDGSFTFPALMRGHYKVESSASGFAAQAQNVELQVQQVQTLEFKLATGTQNTTVEVSDAAPIVDLATSSTGETVEGRQIVDLPLGQRNFTQLATLTPGVTRGAYGSDASGRNGNTETLRYNSSGGAALTVNGLRPQSNNFLLDGTDNNESLVNTIVVFPDPDAIQEFRVTTAVAPAEFGRAGGAIVNTSIKSGTNAIHGSAFGYFRDQIFDARNTYFQPTTAAPAFQRKQFGIAAGGPAWKNRVFLFGDYQAIRLKQPQDSGFHTVPTALMRQGNFSDLLGSTLTTLPNASLTGCNTVTAASGAVYTTVATDAISNPQATFNASPDKGAIFDPINCTQFDAGGVPNAIPTDRINPAGLKYLQAFDNPTVANANQVLQNYFTVRRLVQNYNDFNVRLDLHISNKDSVFVRYSYGQDNQTVNSLFTNLPAGFASGGSPNHPRAAVGGYTRVISPNIVNEFRFAYVRPYFAYTPPFAGTPVSANLGIVNANRNPLLGGRALIGGFNSEIEYTGDGGPYAVPEKTYQFADIVTYARDKHAFKAGANIIRREVDFFQGNSAKGFFHINGLNASSGTGRFTGYEASELLAGFSDYEIGAASTYFDTFNYETGYFVQDDWKISRRLTLNLGVRYDLYTYPYEKGNNQANYDINSGNLLLAGVNGNSRSLIKTDTNNVAPRIGFAYDLLGNGKTSLRGGYGIFYFLDRGGVGNQLSNNPGFNGTQQYGAANGYRITFTGQNTIGSGNNNAVTATQALPLPVFGAAALTPALIANSSLLSEDPNNQNGAVQQWNLQLQQQLDRYTSATIAYVGNKSDHLATFFNANAPQLVTGTSTYTNRQTITEDLAEGTGRYNGLQLSINRNVSNNLLITGAYTWSHTLDNSNGAFSTGANGGGGRFFIAGGQPQFRLNYGNSDQDQPNVFVASAIYNLPYGHGQKFGASAPVILNEILGGWQLNSITTVDGGTPFDIDTSGFNGHIDNRADVISFRAANRQFKGGTSFGNYITYFTGLFADPPTVNGNYQRPGNVARNQFFGPGFSSEDFGLFKNFAVTERVGFQLRAQAYNIFNHPQFTNPDSNIHDGPPADANGYVTPGQNYQFGAISGTRQDSQRELEFAARVNF